MMPLECPREPEVLASVFAGRVGGCRTDGVGSEQDEDLQMHIETCDVCREVVAVASMLREERDSTLHDVQVPAAGQVWWRSAIRARLEAAHAAARPLTWAHGVAGACAAGLAAGMINMAWPTIERGFSWFGDRALSVNPGTLAMADLATSMMQRTFPLALLAACVLLAPVALYFALSDK
jgi:hypothetical protein